MPAHLACRAGDFRERLAEAVSLVRRVAEDFPVGLVVRACLALRAEGCLQWAVGCPWAEPRARRAICRN